MRDYLKKWEYMIKNYVRKFRQIALRLMVRLFSKRLDVTDKKTIVLAPHPDDETFGCGGLISQKIRKGVDVYIMFLTNGEKSLQAVAVEEISQMRRLSAVRAGKVLGVEACNIFWLSYPDGHIPRKGSKYFDNAIVKLNETVEKLSIEEIYVPHYLEGWSDHLAAYEMAEDIAKRSKGNIDLYFYWVWTWYYIGIKQIFSLPWRRISLLPIASTYDKKREALGVYFGSKTLEGELYMGNLPPVFLSAFEWPYEVFEKNDKKTYV